MQQSQQQQQPQLSQQETLQYNRMRQDYADIFRVYLDIDDERKEHNLVIDAIKNVDSNRRCWRLVGGILVERQLDEVKTSLQENIQLLEKTSQNYNMVMKNKQIFNSQKFDFKREKELIEFEMKYNLRPSQSTVQQSQVSNPQKITGVLT